jgi:hypothetical protein
MPTDQPVFRDGRKPVFFWIKSSATEMRVGRLDLRVSAFDLPEVDEMVFFFPSR